jgi:hypothetical protein
VAQRGHDLAAQRAEYYRELYESGRWRHYGSEDDIRVRLTETSAELATWRSMLEQSAAEPVITLDDPVFTQAEPYAGPDAPALPLE